MFAYCNNNPKNKVDVLGHMAAEAVVAATNFWNPAGWIAAATLVIEVAAIAVAACVTVDVVEKLASETASISIAVSEPIPKVETKEKEKVISKLKIVPKLPGMFYGVRLVAGEMLVQTDPMTFEEAVVWALDPQRKLEYGKSTRWGLYTPDMIDAYSMALVLGKNAEPVFDCALKTEHYDHYHVSNRNFLGYFKHFHIWYGNPLG